MAVQRFGGGRSLLSLIPTLVLLFGAVGGGPGSSRVCQCSEAGSRLVLKVVLYDNLSRESAGLYPVNTLRNIALHDVTSEYTLGCVPPPTLFFSRRSFERCLPSCVPLLPRVAENPTLARRGG